jgi:predicted nucleotidyltransferase
MMTPGAFPTPYPDVNQALDVVLFNVQALLGDRFVGMYLSGSLACGDFDPLRSDIDYVVVTQSALPAEMIPALREMHARIFAVGSEWAQKMEGSYIPRNALRRFDPNDMNYPALRVDGSFDIDEHGSNWIMQRHLLRENGIALAGPPARTLIDPVEADEMRRAARGILREWWLPQVSEPFRLYRREYQAYAVLTMCRSFYTLKFGAVGSKPVAAHWAVTELGEKWAGLIERALAWREDDSVDDLAETLDFMCYTLEAALPQ